jgi:tripartite ATP-independent transporter DctP family solute receptor
LSPMVLSCFFAAVESGAADIKGRMMKISYSVAADHPYGLGVTRFAELVNQKTGGKIIIKGYSDGQLGGEVQSISATQGGVLEMTLTGTAAVVGIVKEFALFDFPFLFANEKEVDAVLDGPVGKEPLDKLNGKGLIGLCYWESGFRHTTNSKRPITKLEDFQGLKIRTIQNPVFLDTFNALGANAVPMPFPEVYTALESKAIDGAENTYVTIATSKFNEVQRYLSATRHIYGAAVILMGKKLWDGLSTDEKKILQDSCAEARDYERKVVRDSDAKFLADLKAKGMVFNEIPPEELAKMRAKLKPVIDKHVKEVGENLAKRADAAIQNVRQQK